MANELKLAKAAREIARELAELPPDSPYPFEAGCVFWAGSKAPCCAIGHVIQRAGLAGLAKGRIRAHDGLLSYRSSNAAIEDACDLTLLPTEVDAAIGDIVEANDELLSAQHVADGLHRLADALELSAAPTGAEEV